MTLDQLQVIKTIVELGSFRLAAEKLHRAQSAISYSVKNLEHELGLTLFSREGYRPVLTPPGQAIYQKALVMLESEADLKDLAKQLSIGHEPQVGLAVTGLFPIHEIVPAIRNFSLHCPRTHLNISVEILSNLESLRADQTDVLIEEVADFDYNSFEYVFLRRLRMVPVASPHYFFVHADCAPSTAEIQRSIQVVVRSTAKASDPQAGVVRGVNTWSVSDFSVKKELLLSGLGWGLMPIHLVNTELKKGALTELDIPQFKRFELNLHLIRRLGRSFGPAADFLWTILQKKDDNLAPEH